MLPSRKEPVLSALRGRPDAEALRTLKFIPTGPGQHEIALSADDRYAFVSNRDGGGITVMVDILDMPTGSFGYVPTPALVAPIEFTMRVSDYGTLGGHMDEIKPVADVISDETRKVDQFENQPDPMSSNNYRWAKGA